MERGKLTRILRSCDPVTRYVSSNCNAVTGPVCPTRLRCTIPDRRSHSRTMPSAVPHARAVSKTCNAPTKSASAAWETRWARQRQRDSERPRPRRLDDELRALLSEGRTAYWANRLASLLAEERARAEGNYARRKARTEAVATMGELAQRKASDSDKERACRSAWMKAFHGKRRAEHGGTYSSDSRRAQRQRTRELGNRVDEAFSLPNTVHKATSLRRIDVVSEQLCGRYATMSPTRMD